MQHRTRGALFPSHNRKVFIGVLYFPVLHGQLTPAPAHPDGA